MRSDWNCPICVARDHPPPMLRLVGRRVLTITGWQITGSLGEIVDTRKPDAGRLLSDQVRDREDAALPLVGQRHQRVKAKRPPVQVHPGAAYVSRIHRHQRTRVKLHHQVKLDIAFSPPPAADEVRHPYRQALSLSLK